MTPIARLIHAGKLSRPELSAAEDIVRAYEIQVGISARDATPGNGPAAGAADAGEARRLDLLQDYMRWRRELDGTPELTAAIAMLLDERSARDVDIEAGRAQGTAVKLFVRALRHMATIRQGTATGC